MKNLFRSLMILATATLSITACKKENLTQNEPVSSAIEAEARGAGGGGIKTAPRLTRRGNDSLVYNNDGSLAKVITPTQVTLYSKAGNILTAKTYEGNNLKGKVEYTIDQDGRAFTSKHYDFSANVPQIENYAYDYDQSGRLLKKYNAGFGSERWEFDWDASIQSVERVIYYNAANMQITSTQISHYAIDDKVKVWTPKAELDSYLKIFGPRSAKLIEWETVAYTQNPGSHVGEYFQYTFNRDGYPTKASVYAQYSGAFKRDVIYGYAR